MKEDAERLVHWMEENQQSLQGRASAWHTDVKQQVFAQNEAITVKRIREKAQNMRNAWRNARRLLEQSGAGVGDAAELNAILNSKCPLFWRLDAIWGGVPNTTLTVTTDPARTQGQGQGQGRAQGQEPDSLLDGNPGDIPMSEQESRHDSEDEEAERDETPLRRLSPAAGPSKASQRRLSQAQRRSNTVYLRDIMKDRGVIGLEKEEKRLELERELHRERIKAEDRRLERQLESQERIARIQADGQIRQFQAFMDMMSMVTGSQRPSSFSASSVQLPASQQQQLSPPSDGASAHRQT